MKKYSYWLRIGVLFLLSACQVSYTPVATPLLPVNSATSPKTQIESPKPTFSTPFTLPIPTHTATVTVLPAKTPTVTPTPAIETVVPEIVQICPDKREISLVELGLNPNFRLILAPFNENLGGDPIKTGILTISGVDPTPKEIIPATVLDGGWRLYLYSPSPSNGQWVELNYKREGDQRISIWIGTLDGLQKREIVTITNKKWVNWISDEEMIILGSPHEEEYTQGMPPIEEYIPIMSINPFTGETKSLPRLPDKAIYDFYFSQDSDSYVVYFTGSMGYGPYEKFILYSYTNNTSDLVFQWMTGKSFGNWAGVGRRNNGLFYAYVARPYGFDIAIDMDIATIHQTEQYNEIMKKIILPSGESKSLLTQAPLEFYSGDFPVARYDYILEKTISYYIFDYHNMILKDYCLPEPGEWIFSPDERFAAINMSVYSKAIILDLATGRIADIEGFKVIGWGEVP